MRPGRLLCVLCLIAPGALGAQDAVQARVDSLLVDPQVDALLDGLADRFKVDVVMLVPDLAPEDQQLLMDAVDAAFAAPSLRVDLAESMARQAPSGHLEDLLEHRREGAWADLSRVSAEHTPDEPLPTFLATLDADQRAALQGMVALVEARGLSVFDLQVEETLRRTAHDLVNGLGGGLGAFSEMTDEAFGLAYRDRTISLAAELLHELEPADQDLIQAAVAEAESDAGQWFSESYLASTLTAIQMAGRRLDESLTAAPTASRDDGLCRVHICGFVVDWRRGEPVDRNPMYGAAGELEVRVVNQLTVMGYRFDRERRDGGLTVRLYPETTFARCDFMPGTDTRRCLALERVRVEFIGSYPDRETPNGFIVRNRCGADELMHVEPFAAELTTRLHEALTFIEEGTREPPSCQERGRRGRT